MARSQRRFSVSRLLLFAAAFVGVGALPCPGQDLGQFEEQFISLVERARPSVVTVTSRFSLRPDAERTAKTDASGTPPAPAPAAGGAAEEEPREDDDAAFHATFSGVIVQADGVIVTVANAVDGARSVEVRLFDETRYPATVVGFDRRSNLGVLRIAAKGLRQVEFAERAHTRVGAWVVAVGNPFGLSHSVSQGLISGIERNLGAGSRTYTGMLQTTAPINPGDAGGLLVNLKGQCVGIISSTYQRAPSFSNFSRMMDDLSQDWDLPRMFKDALDAGKGSEGGPDEMIRRFWQRMRERRGAGSGGGAGGAGGATGGLQGGSPGPGGPMLGAEGINFATPADSVALVVKRLLATGKMERARLGVRVQVPDAALRAQLSLPQGRGIVVSDLETGGPAEAAGLQAWDVLLSFNGTELRRLSDLERAVASSIPSTEVTLVLVRKGQRLEFKVKLDARPPDAK
ncbi:MAG: trypsin-like peptidase domain-containing protein [Planctomycetes bacterium]|nr:trypsin-like peptidase domain-containing protein [Planctomycetota bacterium]